jgi:uncharacterized cupin superfamily protein
MKKYLFLLSLILSATSLQSHAAPEVLPLKTKAVQTMTLDSIPPYRAEDVLKGTGENWLNILHQGEVIVAIYEAKPALINIQNPFPYDEFVMVLEGQVMLTHINGQVQTYNKGDNFLVPKGFLGTWDMPELYREMIVIETKAFNATKD